METAQARRQGRREQRAEKVVVQAPEADTAEDVEDEDAPIHATEMSNQVEACPITARRVRTALRLVIKEVL